MKFGKFFLIFFLIIIFFANCSGTGSGGILGYGVSRAIYIDKEEQEIGGTLAQANKGDILLYNDVARFVIKATQPKSAFPVEGMVVDGDIRRYPGEKGKDSIGGAVFFYYPGHFLKPQAAPDSQYPDIYIMDDGSLSGVAQVRVTGVDTTFPFPVTFGIGNNISGKMQLSFQIDYLLPPDSPCLQILATVKNEGTSNRTIYPGIMVIPGTGKIFSGGYGFGDPNLVPGKVIRNVSYLSIEEGDFSYGFYFKDQEEFEKNYVNLLQFPYILKGDDGFLLFSEKNGSGVEDVVLSSGEEKSFVMNYCAVRGYSGDVYKVIAHIENVDKSIVKGRTCLSNGNDRIVKSEKGERKVCTTKQDIEALGGNTGNINKLIDNVDIYVFDQSKRLIAHTKSGDDSEIYYKAFLSGDFTQFYNEEEYKGAYSLSLPGTNYTIWAVKDKHQLGTPAYLDISPEKQINTATGIEVDDADFLFSQPVTLDIFAKIIPYNPTSARLIISSTDLFPPEIINYLSSFGIISPYSSPETEVEFIPDNGHLVLHLEPGHYEIAADKGLLYNEITREVSLHNSSIVLFKFKKVVNTGGYENVDPFIENFSFRPNFSNIDRELSINVPDLEGAMLMDKDVSPITWETDLPLIYGSYLRTELGTFSIFPIKDTIDLFDLLVSPDHLFNGKKDFYTVVMDPSSPDSYFYHLGITSDILTGKAKNKGYKDDYDFIQILPVSDLHKVLLQWFRLLQYTPKGKPDNFEFHPIIGGSMSSDPLNSPPGYIQTFYYSGKVSGVPVGNDYCKEIKWLGDVSDDLCILRNGISTVGQFIFFSASLTSSSDKEALPGNFISLNSGEKLFVNLDIQAPIWSDFDKVYIFDGTQDYGSAVTDPFSKAYSFTVTPTVVKVGTENSMARYEWKGTIAYPFPITTASDSWMVVVVTGSKKVRYSPSLKPFAISNPIFIDSDTSYPGYNPPCPGSSCPSK